MSVGGKVIDIVRDTETVWINTDDGYYLIQVVARETGRALTREHRAILAQKTFDRWITDTAVKGAKAGWIKWDWGSETYNWAIDHLDP